MAGTAALGEPPAFPPLRLWTARRRLSRPAGSSRSLMISSVQVRLDSVFVGASGASRSNCDRLGSNAVVLGALLFPLYVGLIRKRKVGVDALLHRPRLGIRFYLHVGAPEALYVCRLSESHPWSRRYLHFRRCVAGHCPLSPSYGRYDLGHVHRMRHGGRFRGQRVARLVANPSPWLAHAKAPAWAHNRRDVRCRSDLHSRRQRLDTAKPAHCRACAACGPHR